MKCYSVSEALFVLVSLPLGNRQPYFCVTGKHMRILQTLNNNVAIGSDDRDRTCVVFGRGIGFPRAPYDLSDESVIVRRFYEFDESLVPMVANLSEDVLTAASEIVQEAHSQLNFTLNPNLAFTLSDHLSYALSRIRNGISLEIPLESEVNYVYPRELAVGRFGLQVVKRHCGVELPATEATAIALHLVNAEGSSGGSGNIDLVVKSTEIIDRIIAIVESCLEKTIDRDSYSYMRFVMHLRFLIARLMGEKSDPTAGSRVSVLLPHVRAEFPQAVACAEYISKYLREAYGWNCSDDELLYLILHSNQFITGQ